MAGRATLVAIALAAGCCGASEPPTLPSLARTDVGFVDLDDADQTACMGALVTPNAVVTAAHCVDFGAREPGDAAPRVGRFTVHLPGGAHEYDIVGYESLGHALGRHDVALLRLRTPVPSAVAAPVGVAAAADFSGLPVYGFARSECAGFAEDVRRIYAIYFGYDDATVCAGDSGAPLVAGRDGPVFAVTSGASGCDHEAAYANVAELRGRIAAVAARWGYALAGRSDIPADVEGARRRTEVTVSVWGSY